MIDEAGLELNRTGHVKPTSRKDLRPGCQRDREASLPLSRLQSLQEGLGWATIGNLMSAARMPLTAWGVFESARGNPAGLGILAAAGLSDLEGNPARLTGTDDPKNGARNDVVADFGAATILTVGSVAGGILPPLAAGAMVGPKLANAANVAKAKRDGVHVYTDMKDKAMEVLRWLTAAPFFGAHFVNNNEMVHNLNQTGWVLAATVAVGGIYSSFEQFRRRRKAKKASVRS